METSTFVGSTGMRDMYSRSYIKPLSDLLYFIDNAFRGPEEPVSIIITKQEHNLYKAIVYYVINYPEVKEDKDA